MSRETLLFTNDTSRPLKVDAAFWRERAREAQERIRAGMARPGDGVLAFTNLVEDGCDWVPSP